MNERDIDETNENGASNPNIIQILLSDLLHRFEVFSQHLYPAVTSSSDPAMASDMFDV